MLSDDKSGLECTRGPGHGGGEHCQDSTWLTTKSTPICAWAWVITGLEANGRRQWHVYPAVFVVGLSWYKRGRVQSCETSTKITTGVLAPLGSIFADTQPDWSLRVFFRPHWEASSPITQLS